MEIEIRGRFGIIREASDTEVLLLQKYLTFETGWGKQKKTETLLFKFRHTYFTFWGIFEYLKDDKKFNINIINQEKFDSKLPEVSKTCLKGIELYDFQVRVVQKTLMMKVGMCDLATSSGKTEILLATLRILIDSGEVKTATIVVPSVFLAENIRDRAIERGFSNAEIGILCGEVKDRDKKILVCVINSLHNCVEKYLHSMSAIDKVKFETWGDNDIDAMEELLDKLNAESSTKYLSLIHI